MTPKEAERLIQLGYLNGQSVLKALWRRRLKMMLAAVTSSIRAAIRSCFSDRVEIKGK